MNKDKTHKCTKLNTHTQFLILFEIPQWVIITNDTVKPEGRGDTLNFLKFT